ncbi:hypothetical protein HKD21_10570 [Gluconobacter cerevisiae]|uniref:Uncharacterized protein n=1 Tax=Gluconobacter cerevisiae TaxID=1379734 RepID=A0ABR9YF90_9PROT|nr:hypothetical protein [Gluconobacter cerevisiae]MBF0877289.1 hypothetical protein [Gluconobacter cerevisiae]
MAALFRIRLKIYLICILVLTTAPKHVNASDAVAKDEQWGMAVNVHDMNGCQANIDIDQQKFSAQLPEMIESGLFNKRLDPEAGNSAFHYLANIFSVELFKEIIPKVMRSVKNESCHFSYSYISTDQYGNDDKKPMFSFDFSQSTYQKINWDRFDPDNVRTVSKQFSVSPEFNELVQQESFSVLIMLKN